MADGADLAYSTRVIGEHHDLLVGVAYRVLGSVTDAEDAVQEAWLRWSKVDPAEVANPRAFLVRVTTRLAIDRLRRAKARRESYVGPWLHEPVLTGHDVAEEVELAESVSMAMLMSFPLYKPLRGSTGCRARSPWSRRRGQAPLFAETCRGCGAAWA
jgi:DNA-directed RNA polymerase specialized sigma24 family protein